MCQFKTPENSGASSNVTSYASEQIEISQGTPSIPEEFNAKQKPGDRISSVVKHKAGRKRKGRSMGRFPFLTCSSKYLTQVGQSYSQATLTELERRYRRMDKDLRMLENRKKINSSNPEKMTPEDVLAYVGFLKSKGMKESGICHNLGPLDSLLNHFRNPAVQAFKKQYPCAVPKKRMPRLPPMEEKSFSTILEKSRTIKENDWETTKAYSLVILAISTGLRNKEIRMSNVDDVDTIDWVINVTHVKGEGTYGQPRTIPIRPEAKGILVRYLKMRNRLVTENCPGNAALFPALRANKDGRLSSNTLQKLKKMVEIDTGLTFNLRTCRRTYGQLSIDQGLNIESVSVIMGHSITKTTETYYCRKRQDTAIREAQEAWKSVLNNPGAISPKIELKNYLPGYG
jgi:integrase/recombinase XerD